MTRHSNGIVKTIGPTLISVERFIRKLSYLTMFVCFVTFFFLSCCCHCRIVYMFLVLNLVSYNTYIH